MISIPFTPGRRPPLAHQEAAFNRFKDDPYWALFWQQRVRKTEPATRTFRYHYGRGHVDALLVFAWPNGVHRTWIDEIQKDFPEDFLAATRTLAWASGRSTVGRAREEALALRDHPGPIVATFNCEALVTPKGWKYVEWLLAKRRAMIVADECDWASSFNKRTQKLLALGRRPNALVKVILSGTPCDEGPCDLLYPTNFLRHGLLGYTSMVAFKNRYLAYEQEEIASGVWVRKKGYNRRTNTEYDIVVGTQNLDELHANLDKFSSRLLRSDVGDAPEKTFQTRYFQLTETQQKAYIRLRDQYLMELSRGPVPVAHVLTRMQKLSMVARNFAPPDRIGIPCTACAATGYLETGDECAGCGGLGARIETTAMERIDPARNPAAEALIAELRATRGPVVVWARFLQETSDAVEAARKARPEAEIVLYDGTLHERDRELSYQSFRSGKADVIVATGGSGLSRGRDLTRAVALIYYSTGYSLRTRRQSEDRAEGLDRKVSTDIVDIVAEGTVDEHVIELLRNKISVSQQILKDPPSKWL